VKLTFLKFLFPLKNWKDFILGKKIGAWVICEPRFTSSREICELWENVNHKKGYLKIK
jgi:hypothetical protein